MIADSFRAFVALTFEEICLVWLVGQAQQEKLPFAVDNVGADWSKTVQVDVAAINWRERQLLFAELLAVKTPKALADLPDGGWTVHYALFARQAFTEAAYSLAVQHGVRLLTLPEIKVGM